MSDRNLPAMGSNDNPVRLDPFQRIIEVGWAKRGGVVVVELDGDIQSMRIFTNDIPPDFGPSPPGTNGGLEGGTDALFTDHWINIPFEQLTFFALPNHRFLPPGGFSGQSPVYNDGDVLAPTGELTVDLTSYDKGNYQNWHSIPFTELTKDTGEWLAELAYTAYKVDFAVCYDSRGITEQQVNDAWQSWVGYPHTNVAIGGALVAKQEELTFPNGHKIKVYTGFDIKPNWPIVCDYYGAPTDIGGVGASQHGNWTHSPFVLFCEDPQGHKIKGSLTAAEGIVLGSDPACILSWDWTTNLSNPDLAGGALAPNACMVWASKKDIEAEYLTLQKKVYLLNMAPHKDGKRYLKTFRIISNSVVPLKYKVSYYPPGTFIRVDKPGTTLVALKADLSTVVLPTKVSEGQMDIGNNTQNFTASGKASYIPYVPWVPWPPSIPEVFF